jgi:hypothetical protein
MGTDPHASGLHHLQRGSGGRWWVFHYSPFGLASVCGVRFGFGPPFGSMSRQKNSISRLLHDPVACRSFFGSASTQILKQLTRTASVRLLCWC